MEEANALIGTGKKQLVMGRVVEAVSALQEACGLLAKKYGDTADECGEAFYWYGKALLDLARMENSVLGNALEGVPEEEEEEEEEEEKKEAVEPKDSNIESAENVDEKTRDELRAQVYDAMAEKTEEQKVSQDAGTSDADVEKPEEQPGTGTGLEEEPIEQSAAPVEAESEGASAATNMEAESEGASAPVKAESESAPAAAPVEAESEGAPAAAPVEAESEGAPAAAPVEAESEGAPAAAPVEAESEGAPAAAPVEAESEGAPAAAPVEAESEGAPAPVDGAPAASPVEAESEGAPAAAPVQAESEGAPAAGPVEAESEGAPAAAPVEAESVAAPAEAESADGEEEEEADGEMEEDEAQDGEDTAEKQQQQQQEEEEEEEVGNLQLAWEMLEVAKVIYKRKDLKEDQLMAAQAHLKLGEVSVESGNYTQALQDFEECLKLQVKYLDANSRLLAETHYQLGVTYGLDLQYSRAIEALNNSISVIKSRLENLREVVDRIQDPEALPAERKELEELQTLLPEIQEKIEDATESLKSASTAAEAKKDVLDGVSTPAFPISTEGGDSSPTTKGTSPSKVSTAPVSDISHLVRKKRKPEESPVKEVAKKVRQDDERDTHMEEGPELQTNGNPKNNEHANGTEV